MSKNKKTNTKPKASAKLNTKTTTSKRKVGFVENLFTNPGKVFKKAAKEFDNAIDGLDFIDGGKELMEDAEQIGKSANKKFKKVTGIDLQKEGKNLKKKGKKLIKQANKEIKNATGINIAKETNEVAREIKEGVRVLRSDLKEITDDLFGPEASKFSSDKAWMEGTTILKEVNNQILKSDISKEVIQAVENNINQVTDKLTNSLKRNEYNFKSKSFQQFTKEYNQTIKIISDLPKNIKSMLSKSLSKLIKCVESLKNSISKSVKKSTSKAPPTTSKNIRKGGSKGRG